MAESSPAVARKRNYYLQIMQTARQMDDQNLVRIILKKMTDLGLSTGAVSNTYRCKVIPIPTIYSLSQTLNQEQHLSYFPTSHKKRGVIKWIKE